MTTSMDKATQTARDYYNSDDADRFYAEVWGGEDIHVGLYNNQDEPIKTASRRTVDYMADRLSDVNQYSTILDLGAGYGGAARRLVERFGCNVICINLSEIENERNRELNEQAGLSDKSKSLTAVLKACRLMMTRLILPGHRMQFYTVEIAKQYCRKRTGL